ncbi:MAG: metal-dependent hydrolase [Thiolinea sp.]
MSPAAHLIIGWLSTVELLQERRERVLVALCGVAPDIDGLGIIVDKITGTTQFYFKYHHYFGHSIFAALILATFACVLAKMQKARVWLLAFVVVHLHILADLAGSRGPDGYQWPVYYLYPLNRELGLAWKYQWELNAWQNMAVMILLLLLCLYYVSSKRITFFEVFSKRLDREAVKMYEKYR